jgi:hypothetical protein
VDEEASLFGVLRTGETPGIRRAKPDLRVDVPEMVTAKAYQV